MGSTPAVFSGSPAYVAPSPGPVVTIGNFDGVHLGHQALLTELGALARRLGGPTCVYTFHPAPRDVLRPGNGIPRIQSLEQRIALLGELGVAQVVVEPFTAEFGANDAHWFATEVLRRRLGVRGLLVGWDFRFGRDRTGDADALHRWLGVPVETFGPWRLDGDVVSSSRIREAVRAGWVEDAARMLGRPHRVLGTVIPGDRRGRTLGFPTANVRPSTDLLPGDGVYAVHVDTPGGRFPGVANLGRRPTFGDGDRVLEVHLLGFSGDLYGVTVSIDVAARIRPERAFDSREALIARIRRDVAAARDLLDP